MREFNKRYLFIILVPLCLITPCLICAQFDDSKIKYQRVQWFIVYPESKTSTSDSLQSILINDQNLYDYKSQEELQQIKPQKGQIYQIGSLTFIESTDALEYYTKIITIAKGGDVIFAKIYLLDNSHHWSNDRILPDSILG